MMGARFVRFLVGVVSILSFSLIHAKQFQTVLQEIADEQQQSYSLEVQKAKKVETKKYEWPEICNQAKDAVVQVTAYTNVPHIFSPFRTPDRSGNGGSGFLISSDGYILTNYHVVRHAVFVCIRFPGIGKENFPVEVIGCCPERDVALLRILPETIQSVTTLLGVPTLPYLNLGDSDVIDHSEYLMALGYPLNVENLKSSIGVYSGKETLEIGECLQTSTPINPGNSGGPFFVQTGDVIGLCVLKLLETEGMAYIIPINNVKLILKDLAAQKIVRLPCWGLTVQPSTLASAKKRGYPADGGVIITAVEKRSIFDKHGIKKGDLLYQVGAEKLDCYGYMKTSWSAEKTYFEDVLARHKFGSSVPLTICRDGNLIDVTIEITSKERDAIDWFHPWIEPDLDYEVFAGMVIVESTLNHIEALKKAQARRTIVGDDFSMPPVLKYGESKNRTEPRLLMPELFPDSQVHKALEKAKSIEMFDIVISKVNGIPVKTIDEFRDAVLQSVGQEFLTIETEGGTFVDLFVSEIVKEEDKLAQIYGFEKSDLMVALEQGIAAPAA